jgi:hypothetical protein
MEGNARTWFTPKQRAELWERWRNGQCVADIPHALAEQEQLAPAAFIHPVPSHRRQQASERSQLGARDEAHSLTCAVSRSV